jgi:single-stranded DNA-binding protein
MAISMSFTNITTARLSEDPKVFPIKGTEDSLVVLKFAMNPIGQKAKDTYQTKWYTVKFSTKTMFGRTARDLKKGAVISVRGAEGMKTYQRKNGETGIEFEIPYPDDLTVLDKGPNAGAAQEQDEAPAEDAAPVVLETKDDPFA